MCPGGDDDSAAGDDDSAAGDDDSAAGDDDSAAGDDDSAAGDDDSGPGDDDSGPGDDDSGPGDDDDDDDVGDDDSATQALCEAVCTLFWAEELTRIESPGTVTYFGLPHHGRACAGGDFGGPANPAADAADIDLTATCVDVSDVSTLLCRSRYRLASHSGCVDSGYAMVGCEFKPVGPEGFCDDGVTCVATGGEAGTLSLVAKAKTEYTGIFGPQSRNYAYASAGGSVSSSRWNGAKPEKTEFTAEAINRGSSIACSANLDPSISCEISISSTGSVPSCGATLGDATCSYQGGSENESQSYSATINNVGNFVNVTFPHLTPQVIGLKAVHGVSSVFARDGCVRATSYVPAFLIGAEAQTSVGADLKVSLTGVQGLGQGDAAVSCSVGDEASVYLQCGMAATQPAGSR
jgi:hypothetical protein